MEVKIRTDCCSGGKRALLKVSKQEMDNLFSVLEILNSKDYSELNIVSEENRKRIKLSSNNKEIKLSLSNL